MSKPFESSNPSDTDAMRGQTRTGTSDLAPYPLQGWLRSTVVSLAEVTFPEDDKLSIPVDGRHLCDSVGLVLRTMPASSRLGVRVLALVFALSSIFYRLKPFWALKPTQQYKHVASWIDSRFALKRFAIRALLTLIKPVHIERRAVKLHSARVLLYRRLR